MGWFAKLVVVVAMLGAAGCGPTIPRETLLSNLNDAMEVPVRSPEAAATQSQVVEDAVAGDALQGLSRSEVQGQIGRGEECSTHPRCVSLGFAGNDWVYQVGRQDGGYAGAVPLLIVGFGRSGRVDRVWNLRTH